MSYVDNQNRSGYCLVIVNTLRPRQNSRHSADASLNAFFNENFNLRLKISVTFFLWVQLSVSQHWFQFKKCLALNNRRQAIILNQYGLSLLKHLCFIWPRLSNSIMIRDCMHCSSCFRNHEECVSQLTFINSLKPSDVLSEPMCIAKWNELQWSLNQNTIFSFQE